MAAVRIELAVFREISSLPTPITDPDLICYHRNDTKCPFYVQVAHAEETIPK
jgi:hypothetical protein